jgi:hypothetical protein
MRAFRLAFTSGSGPFYACQKPSNYVVSDGLTVNKRKPTGIVTDGRLSLGVVESTKA